MGIKTKSRKICVDYGGQTIFREFVTIITVQIRSTETTPELRRPSTLLHSMQLLPSTQTRREAPELMPLFPLSFRRPSTHLDQLNIQVPNWGTSVQSISIQCSVCLAEGVGHFQCQQCQKRPSCNDCTFKLMRLRNSCPLCRFQK